MSKAQNSSRKDYSGKSNYSKRRNNNKGNRNSRREGKNVKGNERDEFNPTMGEQTTNDASWYSKSPQLNKDSASFNFSMALGLPINLTNGSSLAKAFTVPGIIAFDYVPGIGWCSPDNGFPTTVDLASNSLYSFVVHANSRTKLYDAPDYMMYCLAGVDMYAAYADLVRAYGVARWYNSYNRYYPAKVLEALGYSLEDIISNMANFRYQLNRFAVALTSINIPNKLPIYSRQTWLPQNLFLDHPGMKSQTYAFVPKIVHQYEGYSSSNGGYLKGIEWKGLTLTKKLETFTIMLNTLLSDQDIGIMSGDTLKAFGPENLLKVNMIGEDYTTVPVYDETVLMQIENITIAGGASHPRPEHGDVPGINTLVDIWQDPDSGNRIFYTPTIYTQVKDVKYATFNKLINIRHDSPSVDDMFEATRLTTMSDVDYSSYSSSDDYCTVPLDCIGTEIVVGMNVVNMDASVRLQDNCIVDDQASNISSISSFRYHPVVALTSKRDTPSEVKNIELVVDYANYTVLDKKELMNMHNTALLSQFGIPFLGQTTK